MDELKKAILMNEKDNVATALFSIDKNEKIMIVYNNKIVSKVEALDNMDRYHKIAIKAIEKDEIVYKYGEVIGKATQAIKIGEHVHVNNIESVMTK
jgi:altronate dehydratase small subunit